MKHQTSLLSSWEQAADLAQRRREAETKTSEITSACLDAVSCLSLVLTSLLNICVFTNNPIKMETGRKCDYGGQTVLLLDGHLETRHSREPLHNRTSAADTNVPVGGGSHHCPVNTTHTNTHTPPALTSH